MVSGKIASPELWSQGELKLEWAARHMPVVLKVAEKHGKALEGVRVGAVLHVTKETGILVRSLYRMGAEVWLAGSNPLSTQDDVAAALYKEGINVCAWRGQNKDEYFGCIRWVAEAEPDIVMDDGGDLHVLIHDEKTYLADRIVGGTEETTTGVYRLYALENAEKLRYPVIAVNNALTKHLFDNRYGTGQSTVDGILRATNVLLSGKTVVVAGYGWVGRGIAIRMRGMGARVIVTEVNPIRALEAVMDGFYVTSMEKAAELGDIFVTATGNYHVIRVEHIMKMKDGAILANSGHFNVEIDVEGLEQVSTSKRVIRKYNVEYTLPNGKRVYLLAEGRLVNLVAAEGHPSEVMDMSFANQALAVLYLYKNRGKLQPKVYNQPKELDEEVAREKLSSMGIEIDELTKEQINYLSSWK
ncbi:MAG: adenosylhomocysteinase [Desulfurococcales archaeon]|nr:adenosylhomocysteinase [Desulfurococcales archaeon]